MRYQLGVDLGTTYSAAAVSSGGRVVSFGLGNQSHVIPSVVALDESGEVLVGDSAERQSRLEPGSAAREFKRRLGDSTPFLLRGTPMSAEALTGRLLRWIVDRVTQTEGGPPAAIRLTHPANWGPYQVDLLLEAARLVDVGPVSTMSEPDAAAIHYASLQRLPDGAVVAVYDLGGGTFDASVLRRDGDGFATLGKPEGIARLGGIDFDEAVFGHVSRSLGGAWQALDPSDPAIVAAVARLRRDCVAAKEDLSSRTTTSIDVLLPGLTSEVRLTRGEFEGLIALPIEETIAALRRALASAGVAPADLHSVLLVGGSSRVPLVAQMVSAALERPVAVDAHPKYAVSMGAAIALDAATTGATSVPDVSPATETTETTRATAPTTPAAPASAAPASPPVAAPPTEPDHREASLRVPLPPAAPAMPRPGDRVTLPPSPATTEPARVVEPPPQPEPRPRAPFPSTRHATVALAAGVLVLVAALVWAFLADSSPSGVPADALTMLLPLA